LAQGDQPDHEHFRAESWQYVLRLTQAMIDGEGRLDGSAPNQCCEKVRDDILVY